MRGIRAAPRAAAPCHGCGMRLQSTPARALTAFNDSQGLAANAVTAFLNGNTDAAVAQTQRTGIG